MPAPHADEVDLDDCVHAGDRAAGADDGPHAALLHRPRHVHRGGERALRRRVGVEADRVARAHEPLARVARLDGADGRSGAHGDLGRPCRRRLPGRVHVDARRDALPAARGRHAADVRPEGRRGIHAAREPAEERRARRGRDPRVDRRAERPEEDDVEEPGRQLRVEARDDEPRRAGELVLRLRPARREHPRARDGHAHLEAAALVRRAGRPGGDRGEHRHRRGEEREPPHGNTRRNQKLESAPPASSSTIAPPANASVIWRSSIRWPIRVPSRS